MPLSPLSMVCFECKRALSCRVMRWLLSHSPRINKKGGHIFFVKALCHSSIVAAASASKTQNITSAGKITASRPDETKGIACAVELCTLWYASAPEVESACSCQTVICRSAPSVQEHCGAPPRHLDRVPSKPWPPFRLTAHDSTRRIPPAEAAQLL